MPYNNSSSPIQFPNDSVFLGGPAKVYVGIWEGSVPCEIGAVTLWNGVHSSSEVRGAFNELIEILEKKLFVVCDEQKDAFRKIKEVLKSCARTMRYMETTHHGSKLSWRNCNFVPMDSKSLTLTNSQIASAAELALWIQAALTELKNAIEPPPEPSASDKEEEEAPVLPREKQVESYSAVVASATPSVK